MAGINRRWALVLLCAGAIALPLLGALGLFPWIQSWADQDLPWWWSPILALAAGVLVGFALLPTHISSLLAGYLFGLGLGGATTMFAILAGTMIAYYVTQRLGSDEVQKMVKKTKLGRRLWEELMDASTMRAAVAITLARLPPHMPFALCNVLASSAKVPLISLLGGTLVGMAPRALLAVWVGTELSEWNAGEAVPSELLWAIAASLVGFGGLALWSWWLLHKSDD